MDHRYSQRQERELAFVRGLYEGSFQALSFARPAQFQVLIRNTRKVESDERICEIESLLLRLRYTPTYPQEVPEIECLALNRLSKQELEPLKMLLKAIASDSLGKDMALILISAAQEWFVHYCEDREKQRKCMKERKAKEQERKRERLKFEEQRKAKDEAMSEPIVLITDTRRIPCSPGDIMILSTCSPYFSQLFNGPWVEAGKRSIELKDSSHLHLLIEAALTFEEIDLTTVDVLELLEQASRFNFEQVQQLCENRLLTVLNRENAWKMFCLSGRLPLSRLYQAARHIVTFAFHDFRLSSDFLDSDVRDILSYLGDNSLNAGHEFNVWDSIVSWVSRDVDRERFLPRLLKCVKFADFHVSCIKNLRLDLKFRQWKICERLLDIIEKRKQCRMLVEGGSAEAYKKQNICSFSTAEDAETHKKWGCLTEEEATEADEYLCSGSRELPITIGVIVGLTDDMKLDLGPLPHWLPANIHRPPDDVNSFRYLENATIHSSYKCLKDAIGGARDVPRLLTYDPLHSRFMPLFKLREIAPCPPECLSRDYSMVTIGPDVYASNCDIVWRYNRFTELSTRETLFPASKRHYLVCAYGRYIYGMCDNTLYVYDTYTCCWNKVVALHSNVRSRPFCHFFREDALWFFDGKSCFWHYPDRNLCLSREQSLSTEKILIFSEYYNGFIYAVRQSPNFSFEIVCWKVSSCPLDSEEELISDMVVIEQLDFLGDDFHAHGYATCACFVEPNLFIFCECWEMMYVYSFNLQTHTLEFKSKVDRATLHHFQSAQPLINYSGQ